MKLTDKATGNRLTDEQARMVIGASLELSASPTCSEEELKALMEYQELASATAKLILAKCRQIPDVAKLPEADLERLEMLLLPPNGRREGRE